MMTALIVCLVVFYTCLAFLTLLLGYVAKLIHDERKTQNQLQLEIAKKREAHLEKWEDFTREMQREFTQLYADLNTKQTASFLGAYTRLASPGGIGNIISERAAAASRENLDNAVNKFSDEFMNPEKSNRFRDIKPSAFSPPLPKVKEQ